MKTLDSKFLIILFGRILQTIISLVAIKLATSLLSASEMGNYYLMVSIAGFFGFFLIGPIGQYINRKTHQWYDEKNLWNILYIYNFYIIFLAFLSIVIIFILYHFGVGNNMKLFSLSIVIFIYILAHTWNQTIIPMMNMLEHRVSFVLFTLASQLLFLILSFTFINLFSPKGIYWFFGQAISFGFISIVAIIYFRKNIQSDFHTNTAHKMLTKNNLKTILKFSAPLFLSSLFFWLQTQSYPLIIEKFLGSEFLGYFGVGIAIAFAIAAAFESIVMQYLYPQMYKSMSNAADFSKTISEIVNLILPVYILLSIFVSVFAIYINVILTDIKYFNSYIFIIFGIWISFFRMSSNIISNVAHSKMQTRSLILPNLIGAIATIIGLVFASKTQNYQTNIPLVMVIASVVFFTMMYVSMNKIVKLRLRLNIFLITIAYSLPFLFGILFYNYAHNIWYAISIVFLFGIYFLFALYGLINRGKRHE